MIPGACWNSGSETMSADHGHGSSTRAILYAFFANLGIALAKTAAAIYTKSGSMLAEAIHSYADCGNQVLLLIGVKQSQKPPTAEHPLGFGKVTYYFSFLVAIVLFSLGGLFSIYEGWHKLHAPEDLHQVWVALLVLGFAIVLESGSLYGCLKEITRVRGARSFRDWLRYTRNAELVVVLGEDVAALIGLVLAFVFVTLAHFTGDTRFDAAGSISIGIVLIGVSIFLVFRIKTLLVGRSAEPALERKIDELIADDPAIESVLNTITMQFGPKVMLAAKLKMREGQTLELAIARINELEVRLKEAFPEIGWCFMEPDSSD
jgi:cation diffusion facilitator family transporter